MPITTVSAVQMRCVEDPSENLAHAESLVRQAATKGAQIILLPELFERPYFCQERRYSHFLRSFWLFIHYSTFDGDFQA